MTGNETPAADGRMALVRDVAVLQFKLIVDGLRDFLLVPVSLIVGLIGLLEGGARPGREFYRLLRVGRRSERWINLFGAADRIPAEDHERDHFPDADIDVLVTRVEEFVRDEDRRKGMSRQARERLAEVLESLAKKH